LLRILANAQAIQISRNLLLHGKIVIEIRTQEDVELPPDVAIVVTGRRKKTEIVRRFTLSDLEDLSFDLMHLAGRMQQFVRPYPNSWLHIAWQDRCFVLDFMRRLIPPGSRNAA